MSNAEPTRDGQISRKVKENVKLPRTGVITNVREHEVEDDEWNYHLDVRINEENHPRRVPFAVPFPGLAAPPRGSDHPDGPDLALVQYFRDDEEHRPVVTNILYNNEDRPPIGQQGVFRLQRGPLQIEMHPQGEWARISEVDSDGKIELDDSGTATVNADNVVLGSGGNGVITDISLDTTTDGDGHVTSVTPNITRSDVTETE